MLDKDRVFIIVRDKVSVDVYDPLYISDIGLVYSNNQVLKKNIEKLKIYNGLEFEDWDYIDANKIRNKILSKYENIYIDITGSTDTKIEIKSKEEKRPILQFTKILIVSIIMFFGAGLSIIYFHEDVNMVNALDRLYFMFTGVDNQNTYAMNIPYSIGLGVGMIGFFKRISGKSKSRRRKKEPGPMDLELLQYDNQIEEYILSELKKTKEDDS